MKLEKFKQKDPKKIGIIVFTVTCVLLVAGVFFYTSFASFQTKAEFNIIKGTVGSNGDLYFAFYVDDVISKTMPQKGEGYVLDKEKTTCTKGASVEFNETDWSVKVLNMTERNTKCTLYFEKNGIGYIEDLYENGDSSLIYDETVDNNLRYIGADPNNYVLFNNELWRIIGVMNNIDNGLGNKEPRLKIIRSESIGRYSWDNKSDWGSNDWINSALKIVLNEGAYWSRTSGNCPYGQNGATTMCDFTSNGLTKEAKEMIVSVVWSLGSLNGSSITSSTSYILERGTNVPEGRPTEWIGYVGLMYPSDYGYATSGGPTTNRETCLNTLLNQWQNVSDCYNNNWLYHKVFNQWTLTSFFLDNSVVYNTLETGGFSGNNSIASDVIVFPTLYLSSNVSISGGTGSSSDPYQLFVVEKTK